MTPEEELSYLEKVIARMELTKEPWIVYGSIYNHLVKKREDLYKLISINTNNTVKNNEKEKASAAIPSRD